MKKREVPNFVFEKAYDYYFLFEEFDIVFDDEFYNNFKIFLKKINSNKLIIRFDDLSWLPKTHNINKEYVYDSPFSNEIELFHSLNIDNIEVYNINHFISDNNHQWEIFVSIENELAIVAVNKDILDIFKTIFNPYKEESLDVKLNIIGGQFRDGVYKNQFIKALIKNYNLSG